MPLPDIGGDGRARHNVTTLQLGMAIDEVLCVQRDVNIPDMLNAVYAQLDASRPLTIYFYQRRKTRNPQPTSGASIFDNLAPRYAQFIATQSWASKYLVVQMRAGLYIRCGTPACRAEAPPKMLACARRLANATLLALEAEGIERVLVASDIYGSVPEEFPGESYEAAFAAVRELLNDTLGAKRVTAPVQQLELSALDPVGISTLLDFQLAKQAHSFLGMSADGHWLSVYTAEMAEARKRAGRESVMVTC